MYRALSATLLAGAAIAVPAGFVVSTRMPAVGHASASTAKSTATRTPVAHGKPSAKPTATATKAKTVAARTIVGPSVNMQWGPVQVTIVVKGTAVTSLSATAPTERARSAFINNQAIPMLRQEVLQAKTAANIKNIYGISGATMTSQAFYQSLLSALHTAHLA